MFVFNSFQLDVANASLRRGKQPIALAPKAFNLLRYLVEHAGQLVTKDELWRAVWPEVSVTDAALTVCVSELRKALGDDSRTPRYIETVHRMGYRFIATVSTEPAPVARSTPWEHDFALSATRPTRHFVGRQAELAQLHKHWHRALDGERQIVFVTGEPGIGKTALVQSFLSSIARDGKARIGRGQCIEQYGASEPYMPVLEALTRLGQERGGQRIIEILDRSAPSWLVQMPTLLGEPDRERLRSITQGMMQTRMLRDIAEALEAITAEVPLVLAFEDLHWSDFSTLELIATVARRNETARLLIVGTYRPVEMLTRDHPLRTVKEELQLHRQSGEVKVSLLGEPDVAAYLDARLAEQQQVALVKAASLIHRRTEGNPLFMVNVVDYLIEHDSLMSAGPIAPPPTIQQMIAHNLERLEVNDQKMLEAASIAGLEFSAAAVAAALERPVTDVETACASLARREQFIHANGAANWPDATVAAGFRFHHALYEEVLYGRVTSAQRVELHGRIAKRLETAFGERCSEIAAELAHHYSHSDNPGKAVEYLGRAGLQAMKRYALAEATTSLNSAIDLLQKQPHSAENLQRESRLQLALGGALIPVKGEASAEVEQAYARAWELCEYIDDRRRLFQSQIGLWAVYLIRGELAKAYQLAQQLWQLAQSANEKLMFARFALGETQYYMGELPRAREQFEEVIHLYHFERHSKLAVVYDPGLTALSLVAPLLWTLGYPDQAVKRRDEALALAQALSSPHNLLFALAYTAFLHQRRHESNSVQVTAERIIALSTEHGLTQLMPEGSAYRGWALAQDGNSEEGIALIQQSLAMARAAGTQLSLPYFHLFLAEAFTTADRLNEAMSALTEVESLSRHQGAHLWDVEIFRLKGELLLRQGDFNRDEAQNCFQRAIEIGRTQSAKSLELRATMSLARLLANQNRRDEAHSLLAEIYNWFTEGFDTTDLREAKLLLDQLTP
jgi:DNA-binding winged helix-turn-helix (wHTH) protein/predicted ATPase